MDQRLVVVIGMHRSGTSLCANMLQRLGVEMALDPGASPANAKGHWERPEINDWNDRVFNRFGRGWDSPAHILGLPENWLQDPAVEQVKAALVAWLRPELERGGRIGIKDPRTARLFPLWRGVFEAAGVVPRFVFCVREPGQVARSLGARDQMAREQAEYRWVLYNVEAIEGIGADPVCILPYESWFTEPARTLERLAAFVEGAAGDPRAILRETVDADLRHDAEAESRPATRLLHHGILRCVPDAGFDADLRAYAAAMRGFAQLVQPFLVEAEVLRVSVREQGRVIGDLQGLIGRMRGVAA